MNLPLGAVALVVAFYLLKNTKGEPQRFDVKGFLLCGVGFGVFMAGLESLSSRPSSFLVPAVVTVIGLSLFIAAIMHMSKTDEPLFTLNALSVRTFRLTVIGGSAIRISLSTAPFIIPLMLQLTLGYTPVEAGLILLWLFAGNLAIKPATTWLMNHFGFRQLILVNLGMISAGFLAIGQFSTTTPSWVMAIILFISGMNRSMHLTMLNTISFADIPQNQVRDANTLSAVIMQMTRGLGITVAALALAFSSFLLGSDGVNPTLEDFHIAFIIIAFIALLGLLDSVRLPSDAGEAILKRKSAKA